MEFLDIVFTEKEELEINEAVKEFNKLCECGEYPKLLRYTHYELAQHSDLPDTKIWKRFLLHPKIKEWYQNERQIQLNSRIQQLMDEAGTSKSTAAAQTLNTLLQQQKLMEESSQNKTIIVYNFIPLTEAEKGNPNINVLQTIPEGIKGAIRNIKGDSSND
jgi:hypothetical protein